jgi:hypothetical protein
LVPRSLSGLPKQLARKIGRQNGFAKQVHDLVQKCGKALRLFADLD